MRHTILFIALTFGLSVWALPQAAMADDTPAAQEVTGKKKAKKKRAKSRSVVKSFKDVTFFNASSEEAEAAADTAETEEDADKDDKKKEKKEELTPDKRAKYYIYLHSASWCGPCKALMPEVIKQYKQMRKKKVEVILIGYDRTVPEAQKYLQGYKAEFCGVLATDPAAENLPGFKQASGIPYATIVNKKGEVVDEGSGPAVIGDWKETCQ